MALSITEDIRSITDLKRKTNSVLEQIRNTKRPVVLTVNGKAEAVLIDAKEFERITGAFNLLKMIIAAEEDINKKQFKEVRSFFEEFKNDHQI